MYDLKLPGASRQWFYLSLFDVCLFTQLLKNTIFTLECFKNPQCPLAFSTTCLILIESNVFSRNFLLHNILHPFRKFQICQQFKFLNWGNIFFFFKKKCKVPSTFALYQGPWLCPLLAALMMWCTQTTELENFFFNMVIATRRWIENSQVTVFQCSFLWKECPHQSDNRTHMGKYSIRSPKHFSAYSEHFTK